MRPQLTRIFENTNVTVFSQNDKVLLKGWLQAVDIIPPPLEIIHQSHHIGRLARAQCAPTSQHPSTPLTSPVLVPLSSTSTQPRFSCQIHWAKSIKAGNYKLWPGLYYANASNCFPVSIKPLQGQLTKTREGVRSTTPNPTPTTRYTPQTKS